MRTPETGRSFPSLDRKPRVLENADMGDTHGDVAQAKVLSLAVHELRTPMSVFNGYVRMILKDPAGTLDDKYRSWLQEAEKASVRLTALVAEMSDVSALEAGKAPFKRVRV